MADNHPTFSDTGGLDPDDSQQGQEESSRVPTPLGDLPTISGSGTEEESLSPGDVPQIEGYAITGRLGQGGMGTVWKATQLSTRREVALKVLRTGAFASVKAQARFEREVELAARLEHPNIARVYDSGLHQGVYYYAMELIDGVHLDEYVETHNLIQRQILELMQIICQAIQHAHQRGVIHRDLKPSNILVTEDGQPHVLDFGLAKAFLEERAGMTVSIDGDVAGTPAYMSPEQAAGHMNDVDTRSDVYSLGVILYRLLTGQFPHNVTGTRYGVLRRIAEEEITRPREATRGFDRELEALLLKALTHEPEGRYVSAGELGDDIENYLTGEPLLAKKPTTVYFLRKRIRKYRVPVAVATAVLAALIVVAIFAYVRVTQERDRAEEERQKASQATKREKQARIAALKQLALQEYGRARSFLRDSLDGDIGLVWLAKAAIDAPRETGIRAAASIAFANEIFRAVRLEQILHVGGPAVIVKCTPDKKHLLVCVGKIGVKKFAIHKNTTALEGTIVGDFVDMVLSPDGSKRATIGRNRKTCSIYNTKTLKKECEWRAEDFYERARSVFFDSSGNAFICRFDDMPVSLDPHKKWKLLGLPNIHHNSGIRQVVRHNTSPIVALFKDNSVGIVNTNTGRQVNYFRFDEAAAHPMGEQLLVAGITRANNKTATFRIIQLECAGNTRTIVEKQTSLTPFRVNFRFSSEGSYVALADMANDNVQVYDTLKGHQMAGLAIPPKKICHVAFVEDPTLLAVSTSDGCLRLYDPRTSRLAKLPMRHKGNIYSFVGLGNGRIATAGLGGTVKIWRWRWGDELLAAAGPLRIISSSENLRYTLETSNRRVLVGWPKKADPRVISRNRSSTNTGSKILESVRKIFALASVAQAKYATQYNVTAMHMYASEDMSYRPNANLEPIGSYAYREAYSGDFRRVAWSGENNPLLPMPRSRSVHILDLPSYRIVSPEDVTALALSPSGRYLFVGTHKGTGVLHDLNTQSVKHQIALEDKNAMISDATFNPDGTMLAVATSMGRLAVYWVPDIKLLANVQAHNKNIWHVAWNPVLPTLATSGADGFVNIWKTDNEQLERVGSLEPKGQILWISFDRSGRLLLTGEQTGIVRLWFWPLSIELGEPFKFESPAIFVDFFSDDGLIATPKPKLVDLPSSPRYQQPNFHYRPFTASLSIPIQDLEKYASKATGLRLTPKGDITFLNPKELRDLGEFPRVWRALPKDGFGK